jgi:Iap family predicted aminopeptidase
MDRLHILPGKAAASARSSRTVGLSGIPFGGGATDSGSFARAGIPSAGFVGVARPEAMTHYHATHDDVAAVSASVVARVLACLGRFIEGRDIELSGPRE